MCKTVKKATIGAGLGVLALGLLFGTSAKYHAKTAVEQARALAQSQVSIEYKIDEARQRVAALEPAIMESIETLARAQVEVDGLKHEIAVARENLQTQGKEMLALKDGLDKGRLQLTGGLTYTADEIKADLARRLDTFNRTRETVGSLEQTLKAKVERTHAIQKALDEMTAQKKTLTAKIEAIETRLAQIKAEQSSNEFTFDATPLSQAKKTIAELDKQLEVMSRKAELEGRYMQRSVKVDIAPDRDISSEVDSALEGLGLEPDAESNPAT
jgi:chromosome segregation ATPase